jgi:hypothetical protein
MAFNFTAFREEFVNEFKDQTLIDDDVSEMMVDLMNTTYAKYKTKSKSGKKNSRGKNGYQLFCAAKKENGIKNADAREEWKTIDDYEKKNWQEKAKELKEQQMSDDEEDEKPKKKTNKKNTSGPKKKTDYILFGNYWREMKRSEGDLPKNHFALIGEDWRGEMGEKWKAEQKQSTEEETQIEEDPDATEIEEETQIEEDPDATEIEDEDELLAQLEAEEAKAKAEADAKAEAKKKVSDNKKKTKTAPKTK